MARGQLGSLVHDRVSTRFFSGGIMFYTQDFEHEAPEEPGDG